MHLGEVWALVEIFENQRMLLRIRYNLLTSLVVKVCPLRYKIYLLP